MNNFNSLKKSFGFLTAAVLAAAQMRCNKNNAESEISIPENSITEITTKETEANTTALNSKTEVLNNEPLSSPPKQSTYEYTTVFSDRDLNPDFDDITAEIKLNGDSINCNNSGVKINGSDVTITEEGIYRISGTLNNGQIIINAPDSKVQLILDNADINCSTSSAIYGIDSKKIFISLAEDSVNNLSDGENYIYADESSQEPDACIFSGDSLTINGTGTLNINSSLDGIHSKDDIVITNGNINITSDENGIKGKDYVAVADGNINITSSKDGIKSTNITDTSLGYIYIQDGRFTINSAQDGIQAETDLVIDGGNFDITSGGGSKNSTKIHSDMGFGNRINENFGDRFNKDEFNHDDFVNMPPPNDFGGENPPEIHENQIITENKTETTISTKGLKGETSVNLTGGKFVIDSADDAIHSANVAISGDNLTLTAGDDGIHADSDICIDGGIINITDSYEGIEGAVININGGDIKLKSSDDGFNASDGTAQGGMGTYSKGVILNITGGSVYVNAEGDGLDSNGDMTISGGTVIIDGPTNGGNGALDGNNEIIVTGGTLIAVGNSQMAECPSNSSTQYTISATFESTQQAGTSIKLIDENGNEVINFTSAKTFDNIVISSPDILKDKTYTFYLNDTESENFTTNEIITTIGRQSTIGGGDFGGIGGGFDGHGNRGDFQPPTNENGKFEMPEKDFNGIHKNSNTNL